MPVAIRAYLEPTKKDQTYYSEKDELPAAQPEWTLIFDTETNVTPDQALRIGVWQLRQSGVKDKDFGAGLFYDPDNLMPGDFEVLKNYQAEHGLKLITRDQFVQHVFYERGYDFAAAVVGFNLPFDLSRLSIRCSEARKKMRGGFSLALCEKGERDWPNIRVKHLNQKSAFIEFEKKKPPVTEGQKKNDVEPPAFIGFFVDVKTLAAALTGANSHSLDSLCKYLKVEHKKLKAPKHGEPLTPEYLDYAVRDVQATWECFDALNKRYQTYGLTQTPINKLYSSASLGKAYLKQMGIRPWRELQPDFSPDLIGIILSTFSGGRSEVRLRLRKQEVIHCDFTSMYPTVCNLMELWQWVIAKGMKHDDTTLSTQKFLDDVNLSQLQKRKTWLELATIVQIMPDADIFPVRSKYGQFAKGKNKSASYTIGLNYLTSEEPLWFTLADCIASKLLTGKAPKVIKAHTFAPEGKQDTLISSMPIYGDRNYSVNPREEDFYKRLIELRADVKQRISETNNDDEKERLEDDRKGLKTLANSTSYGIFVELNEEHKEASRQCFRGTGASFSVDVDKVENPGRYFHPLLGTLIAGAARLMLAITEHLVEKEHHLGWVFCDTDSMAIAKPQSMKERNKFEREVHAIRNWFMKLNPYDGFAAREPMLKIEDANYSIDNKNKLEQLFCISISAKRYVFFNIIQGQIIIRKGMAHGLGHLVSPYKGKEDYQSPIPDPIIPLEKIELERWQYDLWHNIITKFLSKSGGNPADLPLFDKPAVSPYAATTPELWRWFKMYNKRFKLYRQKFKPFNFLYALHPDKDYKPQPVIGAPLKSVKKKQDDMPKIVAPYHEDIDIALLDCFDRTSKIEPTHKKYKPIELSQLKPYSRVLRLYNRSPELTFLNGDNENGGMTYRRHIKPSEIRHIGKESNNWEERAALGDNPDHQDDYGTGPEAARKKIDRIRTAIKNKEYSQAEIARAAEISDEYLSQIIKGKTIPSPKTLDTLYDGFFGLNEAKKKKQEIIEWIKAKPRKERGKEFAKKLGTNSSDLAHMLAGRRAIPPAVYYEMEQCWLEANNSDDEDDTNT